MTNNSTKSRKGYLGKFTSLGLSVKAEEIYSSSYAAAAYLESINFPQDKKVTSLLSTKPTTFSSPNWSLSPSAEALFTSCNYVLVDHAISYLCLLHCKHLLTHCYQTLLLSKYKHVEIMETDPGIEHMRIALQTHFSLLQVYIVGEVGIQEELDLKGIRHCGGPADADKKIELKPGYAMPHDEDVRCCSLLLCRT